ncbi:MAG: hypothetical protein COB59_03570 [Rhodospirillaceae bacterium]|nr:MAG: hypothetical protein COB59_03570 [Rhodospirillaceae bacterium]
MKRPTFFLSSTIHDFRDLRGAIKLHLEELGCIVLASDYNTFNKPLDQHSYDACLEMIEKADYFVLLIGGRVGGWYDEQNRISITQQEYRTAYDLHKQGKLKIVSFVRGDVWQVREERKSLEKHLKNLEILEETKRDIATYQSKFVSDADFIFNFIKEVGKNKETLEALSAETAFPTGNWIHPFNDFRDIVDVFLPFLFDGTPASEIAFKKALQHELIEILRQCLIRVPGAVLGPKIRVKNFSIACPINVEDRLNQSIRVPIKEWDSLTTMMLQLLGKKFRSTIIQDALSSTIFIEFNSSNGAYEEAPAFRGLYLLTEEIERLNSLNTTDNLAPIFEHSPKWRREGITNLDIDITQITMLLSLTYRWINVIDLASALIKHLNGQKFEMPDMMPFSPIIGMDDAILEETVSQEEAMVFALK